MVVAANTPSVDDYTGNGTASNFAYSFPVFESGNIEVVVTNTSDTTSTTLVLTTDYTINGIGLATGRSIDLVDAGQDWIDGSGFLATGYTMAVNYFRLSSQSSSFANLGPHGPKTFEKALDRATMDFIALDNQVDGSIVDGAVTAEKLAASAVETDKINALAVTTAKIAADAIDGTKIADDSIDSEHYVAGSIDPEHLATDSVETAKILALNVTTAKIAADAIDGTKIADDAVDNEHIAADAVQEAQIQDGSVTAAKIAAGLGAIPSGIMMAYGAITTAPSGWAFCDGAALSRTTESALFAIIGTTYGVGDGSTTFNVPDKRGQFNRGVDDMGTAEGAASVDTGRALGSSQADEVDASGLSTASDGAHTHSINQIDSGLGGTADGFLVNRNPTQATTLGTNSDGAHTHTISGGGTETRPVNVADAWIIKL